MPEQTIGRFSASAVEDIAQSLAALHASTYYIDAETHAYAEFESSDAYKYLDIPSAGDDFFAESRLNVPRVVAPDDVDSVLSFLDPARLKSEMSVHGSATCTYRLYLGGEPTYVTLDARWSRNRSHIIVVVSDTDELVRQMAAEAGRERVRIYATIAQTLASQYATIYLVDVYTKHYMEFASSDAYKDLEVPPSGDDFFAESRKNILRVIHPDDVDAVLAVMDRDLMTQRINEEGRISLTYRLLTGDDYRYVNLTASWADDRRHIIIGVTDVDAQVKERLARKEVEERSKVYGYIAQSLANQYATIYYVDVYDESYIEFASSDIYKGLEVPPAGDDFFASSRTNAQRVVHPDDVDALTVLMDRDRLTSAINERGSVSITYRLMLENGPVYTSLRAVWADDKRHLIIGVSNVDAEMRREREHARKLRVAREKALRDELTGVRNQNAFAELEEELGQAIEAGTQEPFALVVCDVNGLKDVNDTLGHKAGDAYIREACELICQTYSHSPVFRTGGDEFVAVLQGRDYQNRDQLLASIRAQTLANQEADGVIVATGMADFQPGADAKVAEVYNRADDLMYANKKSLKGARV